MRQSPSSAFIAKTSIGLNISIDVYLDALLIGHDSWVYSVCWSSDKKRLLSSSADKTMIIWEQSSEGIWEDSVTFGDVGGTSLGYFGALFGPDGKSLIAQGYSRAIHYWTCITSDDNIEEWRLVPSLTGHFGPVKSLAWEPEGFYFGSASSDQTVRIFSPCGKNMDNIWHEIARPQIHGYNMQSLTWLSSGHFASGGDEKVIRVFESTGDFLKSISSKISNEFKSNLKKYISTDRASVTALGLSNKSVNVDALEKNAMDTINESSSVLEPFLESSLSAFSLWPEVDKLYGHGYEIYCVTSDNRHKLLASSCKASNKENAAVRLWEVTVTNEHRIKISPLGILSPFTHSLTVTCIRFSISDRFLITGSRDRTWSLWKKPVDNDTIDRKTNYCLFSFGSGHCRIIWDVCFSSCENFFFTASRDKKVKAWEISIDTVKEVGELEFPCSVNSIDFSSKSSFIVCGREDGKISIVEWDPTNYKLKLISSTNEAQSHGEAVTCVRWKPSEFRFASCSEDCSVRLFLFKN